MFAVRTGLGVVTLSDMSQARVDEEVLAEVRRRFERYERGETVAIPFEQVQAEIDAVIERAQLASGRR